MTSHVLVVVTDEESPDNDNSLEQNKLDDDGVSRPTTLFPTSKSFVGMDLSTASSAPATPLSSTMITPMTTKPLHRHSKSRLSLRDESITTTSVSSSLKNAGRFLRSSFSKLVHPSRNKESKVNDHVSSSSDDDNEQDHEVDDDPVIDNDDFTARRRRSHSVLELTPDAYIEATFELPVIPFAFPTSVLAEKMERRLHHNHGNDNDDDDDKDTVNDIKTYMYNSEEHEECHGSPLTATEGPSSLERVVSMAQKEYLEEKENQRMHKMNTKHLVRDVSTDEGYVAMAPRTPVQRICHQDAVRNNDNVDQDQEGHDILFRLERSSQMR